MKGNLVLSSTWTLPLVPADRFQEAINVIERQAQALVNNFPNVNFFIAYLKNYWLSLARQVSVAGNSVKTNNISETLNRQLPKKLGGERPPIPRFLSLLLEMIKNQNISKNMREPCNENFVFIILDRLSKVFSDTEILWEQLDNPVPIDTRRLSQIDRDRNIRARQELLRSGRYTMEDFLTSIFDHENKNSRIDFQLEMENC